MAKPLSRAQRAWLKALGSLVDDAPADVVVVDDEILDDAGVENQAADGPRAVRRGADAKALRGAVSTSSPLETPAAGPGQVAAARDARQLRSTVIIFNKTGFDLRFLRANLKFRTARFVPNPPARISAFDRASFQVVETAIGPDATAGSVQYHSEQRRRNIDVTFAWERVTAEITFQGDGSQFQKKTRAERDTDVGNEYTFLINDLDVPDDEVRIDVSNESGFAMTLVSATLDDPQNTEFSERPDARLEPKGFTVIRAQPLDNAHPEAAGTVVYRVERPGNPPLARMNWRKGADPTGTMQPDDGAFAIVSETKSDKFTHEVQRRAPPPPPPPAPTKVTIVNNASFAMKRSELILEARAAQFKSQPDETIESGRSTRFEVESKDSAAPETDGSATYTFKSGADPAEHAANMAWRSKTPSTATVSPPAQGVTIDVSGSNTDVVFTVTGPPLDFNPPEKIKQPTLRLRDKSPDGWVEYLQEALNHHINAGLVVDGDFGNKTLNAVIAFQTKHKNEGVLVDGVVGDQTWSFLRQGVPEKPATDGLPPHTFVEGGIEARWVREKEVVRFDPAQDELVMQAVSVGDAVQIEGRPVRIRVTNPTGVQKVLERPIGPGVPASITGQGTTHDVKVERFSTLFDETATNGPPPGNYTVEAFFDQELGGDKFSEVVVVPPR